MDKIPYVSIIVPVWCDSEESFEMTMNAIRGMEQTSYDNFDLTLVDDCSPLTTTYDRLFKEFGSKHLVIQTPDNGGSTNAVNYGLRYAKAKLIQYQNNDTLFPHRDWLYEQTRLFDDPQVGVVGSLLRYETGLIQHGGACWRAIGNHAIDHIGQYQKEIAYLEDVPFVTGCGMTVRREILDRNGGFTVFPGYGWDDIDIQVKAKRWGYKVKIAPKSQFIHLGSVSYKKRPELLNRELREQNKRLFDDVEIKENETIQYFIDHYYKSIV